MFKRFGFMRISILFTAFFLIAAQGVKAEEAEYTAESYNAYANEEPCWYIDKNETTTYKYKGKTYKNRDSEDDVICAYGSGKFSMSSGTYGTWKKTSAGYKMTFNTKLLVKLYKKGFKAKTVTIKTAEALVKLNNADGSITGNYLIKGTATLKNKLSVPFTTKGTLYGDIMDDEEDDSDDTSY